MKVLFLKDKYNNETCLKKLGFKLYYHYNGYIFDERSFNRSKITNPSKVCVTYRYRDEKADDGSGSLSRALQSIEIYGSDMYRPKGFVDISPQCSKVDAVLPKLYDMVLKDYFEIRDVKITW